MRTPESTIRERILFPEQEIRLTALAYFTRDHRQDETLMPLVIQAIEQYGRDTAFDLLREAEKLPQTAATIRWLTDELAKDWYLDDVNIDNYRTAVALVLCHASVDLLGPEMVELPAFPEELKELFSERLEMGSWDWETGWAALEQLGRKAQAPEGFLQRDVRRADRIIESLARHPDKAAVLLPLLECQYQGHDLDVMEWLGALLVELAGRMRLTAAVPILVEQLFEEDFFVTDSCLTALKWIGGDEVVRTLAEHWPTAEPDFRQAAAEILEHVHTDLSAKTCLEFFLAEEDDSTRDFLANALLGNFVEAAIEPIRQIVTGEFLTPDLLDLKHRLIAACTVMGKSFPEYQEWYAQAAAESWGWGDCESTRIRECFGDPYDDFDDDWFDPPYELEDEDFEDEESADEPIEASLPYEQLPRLEPIRREQPRVGRNDPCPCGSGKKYKKCCLGKDQKEL